MKKNLDLIEKIINAKEISEYEIYLLSSEIYETQFLKDRIESERQVNDLSYFIRILDNRNEGTGVGVIKGNQFEEEIIEKSVERCRKLSQINEASKYYFPSSQSYPQIETAPKEILDNPLSIIDDLTNSIKTKISTLEKTKPTFGRFRLHIDHKYLRNSSGLNLDTNKSYFYMEFAIKAERNEKLSEFWDVEYIKRKTDLEIEERLEKWERYALANLDAEEPISNNNATVIFSPNLLKDALSSVIGFHSSGKAYHEKTTSFNIGEQIADSKLTILDNGILEGGLRTSPWDGEGNPQQKKELIKEGIFNTRLYDQKYAILEDAESTGNGIRTSNGTIENTISNIEIEPGPNSLDEIISDIKDGYLIEKCSWLNPDDYSGSFGTEIRNGYYIKDGSLDTPIKGGNLSGNVLQMIKNCLFISKERKFSVNSYLPYIAFSNLNVSS